MDDDAKRKANMRRYKAQSRARIGKDKADAKKGEGLLRILDLDWLMARTEERSDGCRAWTGLFAVHSGVVTPIATCGEYARTDAQKALFVVKFGRRPYKNCRARTSCGYRMCMEPSHLIEVPILVANRMRGQYEQ